MTPPRTPITGAFVVLIFLTVEALAVVAFLVSKGIVR